VWRDLAERIESKYELKRHKSVEATLRAVESGDLDVAVGPISITAERAKRVEFTQPYFDASTAIAAPPGDGLWARIRPLLSTAILTALAGLLFVLSIVGS
jgi:polar amino acid transport system substrate-binding protein